MQDEEVDVIDQPANPVDEPKTVEVDAITNPVDANDAIIDDDGNVIQHFDREKNTIYKVKGKSNPLSDEPEKKVEEGAPGKKEDAAKEKPAAEGSKEDEVTYLNDADYVLKATGYDKDEIDLGEGIGVVKIADLTPEQQVMVLRQEYDATIEEYQSKVDELEARVPELKFDNPQHQQIVDYLKEGGDIKKLAKEILSKDPAAQAKMLSDAEVVKLAIKKEFPTFTDEEVEDELKDLSEAKVARRAKALREKMANEQPDISTLTQEQKAQKALAIQKAQDDYKAEAEGIKAAIKKIDKIAGVPLKDDLKEYLIKKTVPEKYDEDSEFVKSISTPEKLATLQFWDTYGEKLLKHTADFHYKRGLEESNKGKEDLSDEPLRTYQLGLRGKQKKQARSIDDFPSFDAFVNADGF